jgi:hypothetical protein
MPLDNAGNTLATAKLLQVSAGRYQASFTDRVDHLDSLDYYKFQVTGRSSLNLAVSGLSDDVTLNLLKSDGTLLKSSNNSAAASELLSTVLDVGTYYIQVTPSNTTAGSNYRFDFETSNAPRTDVAWRYKAGGYNAVWHMDGAAKVGGSSLNTVADPNWEMSGSGDFNADGQTDYLWRYLPTGQNQIWQMNNGVPIGKVVQTVDPSWQISQVADMNGDGKSDIVWRHQSGVNAIWQMDGNQILSGISLPTVADRNWSIGAAADFNNDGRGDLVWRHSSGANQIWFMNAGTIVGSAALAPVTDPAWSLAGAGDFNNDGKSDLLWRHSSGVNQAWHMSNAQIVGASVLPSADANWQVRGISQRFEPTTIDAVGDIANTAFDLGNLTSFTSSVVQGTVKIDGAVSGTDISDYYKFTLDSRTTINLNLTGLTSDVDLFLFQRNPVSQVDTEVARSVLTENASEKIFQALEAGTYYIQVYRYAGETNYALNLNAGQFIQVEAPNESKTFVMGSTQTITWTDSIAENVRIDLYKGDVLKQTIASSVASSGSYAWNVSRSLELGKDYRIKITSVNNAAIADLSDSYFTIKSDTPELIIENLSFSGREGDAGKFKVRLSDAITSNVTVTFNNGNFMTVDADGYIPNGTQSSIIFTSADWNTARDVSFIAEVDDSTANRTDSISYSLSNGSSTQNLSYSLGTVQNTYAPDRTRFNIDLDFRNDYLGFWTPGRRAVAQRIANSWAARIRNELPTTTLNNLSIEQLAGPQLGSSEWSRFTFKSNRTIDDLVIFMSEYTNYPSASGVTNPVGLGGWDDQDPLPRARSVSVNFDTFALPPYDYDEGVALVVAHELAHALGMMGSSQQASRLVDSQNLIFRGENARLANGGNYISLWDVSHPRLLRGQSALAGNAEPTNLDFAILADIGYAISGINA